MAITVYNVSVPGMDKDNYDVCLFTKKFELANDCECSVNCKGSNY